MDVTDRCIGTDLAIVSDLPNRLPATWPALSLRQPRLGQGLPTEMGKFTLNRAFTAPGIERIWAVVRPAHCLDQGAGEDQDATLWRT